MSILAATYLAGWLAHIPLMLRMPRFGIFADCCAAILWALWPVVGVVSFVSVLADNLAKDHK